MINNSDSVTLKHVKVSIPWTMKCHIQTMKNSLLI